MERTELFICQCFDVSHQLILQTLETEENEERIVYGNFHLVHLDFWDKLKSATKYLFGIKREDGDFDAILLRPEEAGKLEWFANYLNTNTSIDNKDTTPLLFTFCSKDNVYNVTFEPHKTKFYDGSIQTHSELSICVSMKPGNVFYRLYRATKHLLGYCSCYGDIDSFEFKQADAEKLHRMVKGMRAC